MGKARNIISSIITFILWIALGVVILKFTLPIVLSLESITFQQAFVVQLIVIGIGVVVGILTFLISLSFKKK